MKKKPLEKKPAELTLAEVYRKAPLIYAFKVDSFDEAESSYLRKQRGDRKYLDDSFKLGWIDGSGLREAPYHYRSPADVSPFYAIIELWFIFRHDAQSKLIFIEVNDWVFQVKPEGVAALDGRLTRLLPES